ncbi:heterokaryon incompatibility protein [Stagonosporopsis vannaccii]|nr:heterokaryon incompatibility protein [Stagonosporopsis vannaccii]
MKSTPSLEENLLLFPRENEDVVVRPDQCACCKSSKTQGTLFALNRYRWEFRPWEADGDKFRVAAAQGCRRCGFVLNIVRTYMETIGFSDLRWVRVWNGIWKSGTPRALVYISLSCAEYLDFRTLKLLHGSDSFHDIHRLPWNIATSPTLAEDPTCERALAPAKVWMQECLNFHKECQVHTVSSLPRRVLELSDAMVYLREGIKHRLPSNYACLSHCWGKKGPSIRLTRSSASELMEGVRIDALPKTFSEAAKVCLQLGISLLWIDALCIYQDDLQDWTDCASEMASIYANAQITIAARSSRNSDDGLRHLVKDRFRNILIPSIGIYIREYRKEFGIDKESTRLRPLTSRAWVFQEHYLSPRTLSFGVYQLAWECRRSRHTEEDDSPRPRSFRQTEPENSSKEWYEVVQAYSRLQITYESDKLPALAAVAEKMSHLRKNDTYLAGLWRNTLLQDLQWRNTFRTSGGRCKANAPTWSWASVRGYVIFGHQLGNHQLLSSVELLDVSYAPLGPPLMGRSTESSLTIKGRVGKIERLEHASYTSRYGLRVSATTEAPTSALRLWTWPDFGFPNTSLNVAAESEETLIVLFMTFDAEPNNLIKQYSGLLLSKDNAATAYERIGWLEVSYEGNSSQWDTEDASFHQKDSDSSFGPNDIEASSKTPLEKYMSTLPLESVTII